MANTPKTILFTGADVWREESLTLAGEWPCGCVEFGGHFQPLCAIPEQSEGFRVCVLAKPSHSVAATAMHLVRRNLQLPGFLDSWSPALPANLLLAPNVEPCGWNTRDDLKFLSSSSESRSQILAQEDTL